MSVNTELAAIFERMAQVMELLGANAFRVNAYQRGARTLRDLTEDVADLDNDIRRLTAIDGIGKGLAEKIIEYVDTGRLPEHDDLIDQVPAGVLQMLQIPGVGPKTVGLLWKQGGVESMDELKAKLETGELEKLPRLGAKSLQNIRQSLAFAETAGQRIRIGDAMSVATYVIDELRQVEGVQHIDHAGSLRRGKETIGDVDILVACTDFGPVNDRFCGLAPVQEVLVHGSTKSSVRFEGGLQVDLRVVPAECYGAALMYFTGSKEHNIVLRELAIKSGMRLNEWGLWPADVDGDDKDAQPLAAETEQDVYKKLELQYIEPELREDRGEVDAARKGELPKLVELGDIKAELHAHTTASDGVMSIDELADACAARGFHTVAVTDHSVSEAIANGLSAERLVRHIEEIRRVNAARKDITILAGSEVDILADGKLDYPDALLSELDIVVASPHSALSQDADKATKRLLKAIEHPLVHIIAHPTGRLIGRREGLSPDMKQLITAAAQTHTAMEINANHWRLDLRDTHARAAIEAGVMLSINTDAHRADDLNMLTYGVLTARRAWAEPKHIINCLTPAKLKTWLTSKRKKVAR